jgi:hypothetical protein
MKHTSTISTADESKISTVEPLFKSYKNTVYYLFVDGRPEVLLVSERGNAVLKKLSNFI